MGVQLFVDVVQVVEYYVGFGYLMEEGQDFDQFFVWDLEYWYVGMGGLDGEGFGVKVGIQFDDDILVVCFVRWDVQSGVCSYGFGCFWLMVG